MINIFSSYIYAFLHPFKTQEALRKIRMGEESEFRKMSFLEVLSVSWLIAVLASLGNFIITTLTYSQNKGSLAFFLLYLICFPLFFWLCSHIWFWMLRFFGRLLGKEEHFKGVGHEMIYHALVCQVLTLVPVVGEPLYTIALLFYVYAALLCNVNLSRAQSFIILILPFCALVLFGLLFSITLGLLFSIYSRAYFDLSLIN